MPDATLPPVVILAAGRSSRLGEPKGLVVVRGRPWIEHQLDGVRAAGVTRAVVVLGHDRERYAGLPSLARRAVVVVVNPDPDRGSFSSLQEGLSALAPDEPAFVLPVDVPAARPETWAALAAALGNARAAVPGYESGGGHPVLLSPSFAAHLRGLDPAGGESRLDVQLRLSAGETARVPVDDDRIRLNLNAPEDWGRLVEGD